MHRALRAQVMEGDALIVFVDEVGGNLLLGDLVKDGGLCRVCLCEVGSEEAERHG